MPISSNKCANRMPWVVECCDLCVAILCIKTFLITFWMLQSSRFQIIDDMIAVDTSFQPGEEGALSPSRFMPWLMVCAVAGVVAAIFGCGGVAPRDHPGCLSTHLLMMLILGCVFMGIGASCSQFQDTMQPVIQRQVAEFCGPDTYPTYADSLNCSSQPANVVSPCGPDCESRVTMIRGMGGCTFLDGLVDGYGNCGSAYGTSGLCCSDWNFRSVGPGPCTVGGLSPPSYTRPVINDGEGTDRTTCEAFCEDTPSCSGYTYSCSSGDGYCESAPTCTLVSDLPPTASEPFVRSTAANTTAAIQPLTGIANAAEPFAACYAKDTPAIVYYSYAASVDMSSTCFLTSAFMFAAAIVGAIYTFTVATGANPGSKKGLDSILKKMCCPCLWPARGEGRSGKQLQDDDLLSGAE